MYAILQFATKINSILRDILTGPKVSHRLFWELREETNRHKKIDSILGFRDHICLKPALVYKMIGGAPAPIITTNDTGKIYQITKTVKAFIKEPSGTRSQLLQRNRKRL